MVAARRAKSAAENMAERSLTDVAHERTNLRYRVMRQGAKISVWMPWSRAMVAWEVWCLCSLFYVLVELPLRLAFDDLYEPAALGVCKVVELLIDFTFLFDVVRHFNLAYISPELGYAEINRRKIARRYLRTWFALDVLASIPYDWFTPISVWTEGISFEREGTGTDTDVVQARRAAHAPPRRVA